MQEAQADRGATALAALVVGVVVAAAAAMLLLTLIRPTALPVLTPTAAPPVAPAAGPGAAPPRATGLASTPTPAPTAPSDAPLVVVVSAPTVLRPSVADATQRYVRAWEGRRYREMHRMLAAGAREAIDEDAFVDRYRAVMDGATVRRLGVAVPPIAEPRTPVDRFDVRFRVTFHTAQVGRFQEEYTLPLLFEDGAWRVDWSPDLLLPGLAPDRTVRLVPDQPARGAILDRCGVPLALAREVPVLGVVPRWIDDRERTVGARWSRAGRWAASWPPRSAARRSRSFSVPGGAAEPRHCDRPDPPE